MFFISVYLLYFSVFENSDHNGLFHREIYAVNHCHQASINIRHFRVANACSYPFSLLPYLIATFSILKKIVISITYSQAICFFQTSAHSLPQPCIHTLHYKLAHALSNIKEFKICHSNNK